MLELIWNVYFYGSPIGFLFGFVVTLKPENFEYPYVMLLVAFFAWPFCFPFIVHEFIKAGKG